MNFVVHCKKDKFDVYIAKGSIYGNPFRIGVHGNREQVINKYIEYIDNETTIYENGREWTPPTVEQIKLLKGKILGCWCAPKACHGDILVRIAND